MQKLLGKQFTVFLVMNKVSGKHILSIPNPLKVNALFVPQRRDVNISQPTQCLWNIHLSILHSRPVEVPCTLWSTCRSWMNDLILGFMFNFNFSQKRQQRKSGSKTLFMWENSYFFCENSEPLPTKYNRKCAKTVRSKGHNTVTSSNAPLAID